MSFHVAYFLTPQFTTLGRVMAVTESLYKQIFTFKRRIIALQCCVGFCHTATWISHRYTHVPSLLSLPPTSHPSRTPVWAPRVIQQICTILHMIFICFNAALSIRPTLSFPDCVHRLFSMSVSPLMSCKWAQQYRFLRFHIYVLIHNICFSLSDFILRNRF